MADLIRMSGAMPQDYNKVASIKALRTITMLSLKDAKDAVEMAADGGLYTIPTGTPSLEFKEEMGILNSNGLMITGSDDKVSFILKSLRANAKMAVDAEEHNLAILIIDTLQHYANERKTK